MTNTDRPKFLHVAEVGQLLSGDKTVTRQTLVRRGRAFAEAAGLRIIKVRGADYVSAAELERVYLGDAA